MEFVLGVLALNRAVVGYMAGYSVACLIQY